jgi:hypothetical protein
MGTNWPSRMAQTHRLSFWCTQAASDKQWIQFGADSISTAYHSMSHDSNLARTPTQSSHQHRLLILTTWKTNAFNDDMALWRVLHRHFKQVADPISYIGSLLLVAVYCKAESATLHYFCRYISIEVKKRQPIIHFCIQMLTYLKLIQSSSFNFAVGSRW